MTPAEIFRRKLSSGEITVRGALPTPHASAEQPLPGEVTLKQFSARLAGGEKITRTAAAKLIRHGKYRVKKIRVVNQRVIFVTP